MNKLRHVSQCKYDITMKLNSTVANKLLLLSQPPGLFGRVVNMKEGMSRPIIPTGGWNLGADVRKPTNTKERRRMP